MKSIGYENISHAMDWHDGGSVNHHYWINYTVDSKLRKPVMDFLDYLIKLHNIENADISQCKDTATTPIEVCYISVLEI